jgi:hypothetical protein
MVMNNYELLNIKDLVSQETFEYLVNYKQRGNRVENCVVGDRDTVVWFYDFDDFHPSIGWETSSYSIFYSCLCAYHKGKVCKVKFIWKSWEGNGSHYPERHITGISAIKIEGEQITVTTSTGVRKTFDFGLDEFGSMLKHFDSNSISKTDYTAGGNIAEHLIADKSLTPGQIVRVLQQALSLLRYQVEQSYSLPGGGIFALHYITNGAECLLDVVRRVHETMPDGADKEEVRNIYAATSEHYTTRSGRSISAPALS